MLDAIITPLQDFTSGLPEAVQWLGVVGISAIPFVESYFGSVIGVFAGLPVLLAIAMAVVGNAASMVLMVMGVGGVRERFAKQEVLTPRQRKLRARFDRWGVPGVSLLGQAILPSQITSAAMVGFGANRRAVVGWQLVSITMWGLIFGYLAHRGVIAAG